MAAWRSHAKHAGKRRPVVRLFARDSELSISLRVSGDAASKIDYLQLGQVTGSDRTLSIKPGSPPANLRPILLFLR
jgi:hypothetical protein